MKEEKVKRPGSQRDPPSPPIHPLSVQAMDALSPAMWLFFCSIVIACSWFAANLAVAVLYVQFADKERSAHVHQEASPRPRGRDCRDGPRVAARQSSRSPEARFFARDVVFILLS